MKNAMPPRPSRPRPARPGAPFAAAIVLLAAGCSGTGQPEIAYDAHAVGTPSREIAAGDWTVTLDEATVAFGPVLLCASASGSATLCETALSEITDIARIDALDPEPQRIGVVRGFTGTIRSASFDFGIHWFMTESSPVAAPAAPGGHSARLRGRATRGDEALDFTADVKVLAQFQGQRAVTSVPANATVGEEGAVLTVHFDPSAWVAAIDFDELAAEAPGSAAITPGDRAHDAIVIAMVAQRPPELVWSAPP